MTLEDIEISLVRDEDDEEVVAQDSDEKEKEEKTKTTPAKDWILNNIFWTIDWLFPQSVMVIGRVTFKLEV